VYFSGAKIFNNLPTDLKKTFYDVYKFKKSLITTIVPYVI